MGLFHRRRRWPSFHEDPFCPLTRDRSQAFQALTRRVIALVSKTYQEGSEDRRHRSDWPARKSHSTAARCDFLAVESPRRRLRMETGFKWTETRCPVTPQIYSGCVAVSGGICCKRTIRVPAKNPSSLPESSYRAQVLIVSPCCPRIEKPGNEKCA